MDEDKRTVYTVVTIVVVVGVLFSCIAGALVGGVAGFFAGRHQGQAVAERALEQGLELPGPSLSFPWPDVEGQVPPFGAVPGGMQGALILEVISATPAEEAGLQVGDFITAIDRTPIDAQHPLPEVVGQYKPGDRITVHLWRSNQEESVRIELAENPEDPERGYLGVYFEMMPRTGRQAPND